MDKFKQIPLNVGLINDKSLINPSHSLIKKILINSPFYVIECPIETASDNAFPLDILILSDIDEVPPLYLTTYISDHCSKAALVLIGPVSNSSACLEHICAGAQDYFNYERLGSQEGFFRCLRFAYERQKRWINTMK